MRVIVLAAIAALTTIAAALYGLLQWFSHSGELGDKEKYAAIQMADAEHGREVAGGNF
jgi:hypothetical protein